MRIRDALDDLVTYHDSISDRRQDSKELFKTLLAKHGLQETVSDSCRLVDVLLANAKTALTKSSEGYREAEHGTR